MSWRILITAFLIGCGGGGPGGKGGTTAEICENGVDDDGNGLSDCGDPACAAASCSEVCDDAFDNNLDGLVDCADPSCSGPSCPEDCFDGRDNDGDSVADCDDSECESACDADADGYLNADLGGDDCDDENPEVYPGATEVCDGADNDCNGLTDLDDPDVDRSTMVRFYPDNDGDGFGAPGGSIWECTAPAGYVATNDDCFDNDPAVNPAAIEVCDDVDNNCDGLVDDADPALDTSTATTWWADADGDTWGDPGAPPLLACRQPDDYAMNADDCDDSDPLVLGPSMWVPDTDGDGYGTGVPVGPVSCSPPGLNYGPDYALDCDDADPAINPAAVDICGDGIDQDCSGTDMSCLPDCTNLGWKFGADPTWACPAYYRMPTTLEYARVLPCMSPTDLAHVDFYHDIAVSVGGCNCKWNPAWCGQPSIETINGGRMCGDFDQLHVCVLQ